MSGESIPVFSGEHSLQAITYRTFSVDLGFRAAPEDLMTRFVECLVRLPNLKTLEILGVRPRASVSEALDRECAMFPSIRELRVTQSCHSLIRKCPNLEGLIFTNGFDMDTLTTVSSLDGELKRVAGLAFYDTFPVGVNGKLANISSRPSSH